MKVKATAAARRVVRSAFVTTVVLICAVLSSLAGGVLLAYGLCSAMFHVFRIHSIQAAQQRMEAREAQTLAAARIDVA